MGAVARLRRFAWVLHTEKYSLFVGAFIEEYHKIIKTAQLCLEEKSKTDSDLTALSLCLSGERGVKGEKGRS